MILLNKIKDFDRLVCTIFSVIFVIFIIFTLFMAVTDDDYTKSNRYSSCFERLSENGNLRYEEMKEVCSKYLE